MAKFTVFVRTDKVGSKCERTIEIPDEELEGLEGHERDAFIDEYTQPVAFEMMDWGWVER